MLTINDAPASMVMLFHRHAGNLFQSNDPGNPWDYTLALSMTGTKPFASDEVNFIYSLTQNYETPWIDKVPILYPVSKVYLPKGQARSTSVGDIVAILLDGVWRVYIIEPFGFRLIPDWGVHNLMLTKVENVMVSVG
jgi:hypothetical protein